MKTFFLTFFFTSAFCASINVQQLSQARQNLAGAGLTTKGLVMFAGGYYFGTTPSSIIASKAIDIYNVNTNAWSTDVLSQERYDLSGVSVDSKNLIIFAGGMSSPTNYYTNVDVYDAGTSQWLPGYALTVARAGMMATTLPNQGLIFFAGGENTNGVTNVIDIFNLNTNQASTKPLTVARSYGAATSIPSKGLAFFAGGRTGVNQQLGQSNPSDVIDIYNGNTNTWTTAVLGVARVGLVGLSFDQAGIAFFSGGFDTFLSSPSGTTDYYTVSTNQWISGSIPSVSFAASYPSGGTLNNKNMMFLIGGYSYANTLLSSIFNSNFQSYQSTYVSGNANVYAYNIPNSIGQMASVVLENQNMIILAGGGIQASLGQITGQSNQVIVYAVCNGGIETINPLGCTPCPAGSWCPYQLSPVTCPQGAYCPGNSNTFTSCPEGTYSSLTGATSVSQCTLCPAGTYNSDISRKAISSCLACSSGYYCPPGTGFPGICPSNYYCPTTSQKIGCPAGTYFEGFGALSLSACIPCPPGSYCPSGQPSTLCPAGSYSNTNGTAKCLDCPEGSACALGTIQPEICPQFTYSAKGQSSCSPCPPGQFTSGPGSASCFPCPSDKFKGWWCASDSEKIIFVFITLGSIGSGLATAWKLYKFYNVRKLLLTNEGLPITWRNVVFVEQAIEQKKRLEMTEIGGGDETPILQADQLRKVQDTIFTMQTKITLLEAK